MGIAILKKGVNFTQRKRKWIILRGLFGLSSFGAYRVYYMPSMVRKRKRVLKLLGALVSMAEMLSTSAEAVSVISKDVKEILQSDSGEIPYSLKQLSKIATSKEFTNSVTRVSEAVTVGILKGYGSENKGEIGEVGRSSFAVKLMDIMMSKAGTGFVSVVGSFARNLVTGFYSNSPSQEGLNVDDHYRKSNSSTVLRWVDVVCEDRCKVMIADCIQTFVGTTVSVFLDKTMDINFYDEIFSGLTNPKHQAKMRDILVSLCNGAVETFVKASHQVMTASDSDPSLNSGCAIVDESEYSSQRNHKAFEKVPQKILDISQPVDLQSNRRFVLDVTGRVTFETAKSIVELFMWKLSGSLKRSASVVHEEVVERVLDVITYIGAKSSDIITVCLAMFLHILGSTQALLPA